MKLWKKNYNLNKEIEKFTVGNDFILDKKLVKYDIKASIAHAKMLNKINILTDGEFKQLETTLKEIKDLEIKQEDEDCHTAIENYLTKKLGDLGKKIHTARSRNDQVLAALRLYEKDELLEIKQLLEDFTITLSEIIDKFGKIKIPGYTHMRKAMPTSIMMWLGCFIDSMNDNITLLDSVYNLIDQSPLGSAAGFGVSVIDIDKKMTADKLKFAKVMENSIYSQLSRGKFESSILNLLTQIMFDINKLSTDLILFSMSEFGYVELPDEFCTGSSIMPQKKNPDVLELLRAKYHVVLAEEFKIKNIISNLMSGYNRDVQLTKEALFNSLDITKESLKIMILVIEGLNINKENCKKAMTEELYATEEAYNLVKQGMPFRQAYKKISEKYSEK